MLQAGKGWKLSDRSKEEESPPLHYQTDSESIDTRMRDGYYSTKCAEVRI
jgi:hypothetical protein